MHLFINPLLPKISMLIIKNGKILDAYEWEKDNNTATTFPRHIIDIFDKYPIQSIYCVIWPGPFTLMRIITLTCNTVKLTHNIKLYWLHFFELIPDSYIPIIEANPREFITKMDGEIRLISWEDIIPGEYSWILYTKDFTGDKSFVQYRDNVDIIEKIFTNLSQSDRLTPIYFKEPHITCSNKKTSPSSEIMKNS